MNSRVLYIGTPSTTPSPVLQVTDEQKFVLTSIRLASPTNNNAKFGMYHLTQGETTVNTSECIAHDLQVNSKSVIEFLTHPLPVSPGESIYVSGEHLSVAIYGIEL